MPAAMQIAGASPAIAPPCSPRRAGSCVTNGSIPGHFPSRTAPAQLLLAKLLQAARIGGRPGSGPGGNL
jgi:hypothetical protein